MIADILGERFGVAESVIRELDLVHRLVFPKSFCERMQPSEADILIDGFSGTKNLGKKLGVSSNLQRLC